MPDLDLDLWAADRSRLAWDIRRLLWSASTHKRSRHCRKYSKGGLVEIVTGPRGAGYTGLQTCGMPWACPQCNSLIMAQRALEIGLAVANWHQQGGTVLLATFTAPHSLGDHLGDLLDTCTKSWRYLMNSRTWRGFGKRFDLAGYLRTLEITTGRNGFHPHFHVLLFVPGSVSSTELDDLGDGLWSVWNQALVHYGVTGAVREAFDLQVVAGDGADVNALADYLSKRAFTSIGQELTNTQSKVGRNALGTVPVWQLLVSMLNDPDDLVSRNAWAHYESATFRRRVHVWSRGLREQLGLRGELSDEALADVQAPGQSLGLGITRLGWRKIVATPGLPAQLLELAATAPDSVRDFLDSAGIEWQEILIPGTFNTLDALKLAGDLDDSAVVVGRAPRQAAAAPERGAPGLCFVCAEPLDPILIKAGMRTHLDFCKL